MAISRDTHDKVAGAADSGKTLSLTLAANAVLVAATYDEQNGGTRSMTWNGVSMIQVGQLHDTTSGYTLTIWWLGNPASGTHNLISGFGGGSTYNSLYGVSYLGACIGTPVSIGNNFNISGTTITNTLNPGSNAWYFGIANGSALTGTSNATLLDTDNPTFQADFDSNGIASGTSMTVTRSGTARIGMVSIAIPDATAIYLDNAGASVSTTGSTVSLTSFAVAPNNPLVIAAAEVGGTPSEFITGITYNGVSMTQVARLQNPASTGNFWYIYAIAGQSGTHDIVLSQSGGAGITTRLSAVSYNGVNQSMSWSGGSPSDATATAVANATSITNALTTIENNSWVIAVGADNDQASSPVAGTNITSRQFNVILNLGDSNGPVTPAGSLSQTYNAAGASTDHIGILQMSISPVQPVVALVKASVFARQAVNRSNTY